MISLLDFPTVKSFLQRHGAEPRGLMTAVVKKITGENYWLDLAVIRFTKQGEVIAPDGYAPEDDEAQRIKIEMSAAKWPENVFIPSEDDPDLPERVKQAKDVYWFRNENGSIVMAQVRGIDEKGNKTFFPLTKWDDGEYRWLEPDGLLPLYGLENIKKSTTVFIHEGVKGAKLCAKVANGELDHPWADELSNAVHVAWCGGALNPERTDWSVLKKHGISRAYIVQDNDSSGISATPKIARQLDCVTMAVQFTDQWPRSFDLGDEFPKNMFSDIGGKPYYIGPTFRECVDPATYMTHLVSILDDKGKVKTIPVLRHHARGLWLYLDALELFINAEDTEIIRKPKALDAMLAPFSDSRQTSELLLKDYNGRSPRLVYRPDLKGRKVISNGSVGINTYIPPSIKPEPGDIAPFMKFMCNLIPKDEDRNHVLRWVATVIARPDIRPLFGILAISEQTGTGKTTLGERVLAPLVGLHNTTFPNETELTDNQFNSWIGQKRLAVVNEIYAGHSFKAANRLKSTMTDRYVNFNEKYMPIMKLENFICIYACSNSLKALRLDFYDRRWLVPAISEERGAEKDFHAFIAWLESGGLNIVAHWAHTFDDYLRPGEVAPMTSRKQEMIDDALSQAQRYAESFALAMNDKAAPVSCGYVHIREWLVAHCPEKIHDSDQEIQKVLRNGGLIVSKKRRYAAGHSQKIVMNATAFDRVKGMDEKDALDTAIKFLTMPSEIMNNGELM